jgi:hypothetical protein
MCTWDVQRSGNGVQFTPCAAAQCGSAAGTGVSWLFSCVHHIARSWYLELEQSIQFMLCASGKWTWKMAEDMLTATGVLKRINRW